jgi:hypothetical protein
MIALALYRYYYSKYIPFIDRVIYWIIFSRLDTKINKHRIFIRVHHLIIMSKKYEIINEIIDG